MITNLDRLNPQQKEAVLQSVDKNVVLMAGAGSGKTATLVKRTEYLINDHDVQPRNIMLITFTNKAANEIKERIARVTSDADQMWIGTFHKICVRLIRMFGYKMNINNFTILDPDDQKKMIARMLDDRGIAINSYYIYSIISKISSYKNNLVRPQQVIDARKEDKVFCEVYQEYQNTCWHKRMFDFDDLIIYTILLLNKYEDVRNWVYNNIHYVMLDEAQDTSSSQFQLITLLAGHNNIMVIGDVNQSIYAFRDAKPQYLEEFADKHENTIKLHLEQNYRSTKTIIEAANEVIKKNTFGTKLNLFCENEQGSPIQVISMPNPYIETAWIISEIQSGNRPLSDYAIIYRTNAQARIFEEEFSRNGIAYTVFGSKSFYSLKEVKDLTAYCKAVLNPLDSSAFDHVLNTIKGIGPKTTQKIMNIAFSQKITFPAAIREAIKTKKIKSANIIARLKNLCKILENKYTSCSDIVTDVLFVTDYKRDIQSVKSDETWERLEIINEFQNMLKTMEKKNPDMSMEEIVDQISLLGETANEDKEKKDEVKLMTAHSSKGLEFPVVFIVGTQEELFPHKNAIASKNPEAIEEERRLFYVAMTRAKEKLFITRANTQVVNGMQFPSKPSRFINEIPDQYKEVAI